MDYRLVVLNWKIVSRETWIISANFGQFFLNRAVKPLSSGDRPANLFSVSMFNVLSGGRHTELQYLHDVSRETLQTQGSVYNLDITSV